MAKRASQSRMLCAERSSVAYLSTAHRTQPAQGGSCGAAQSAQHTEQHTLNTAQCPAAPHAQNSPCHAQKQHSPPAEDIIARVRLNTRQRPEVTIPKLPLTSRLAQRPRSHSPSSDIVSSPPHALSAERRWLSAPACGSVSEARMREGWLQNWRRRRRSTRTCEACGASGDKLHNLPRLCDKSHAPLRRYIYSAGRHSERGTRRVAVRASMKTSTTTATPALRPLFGATGHSIRRGWRTRTDAASVPGMA
eukprot:315090-Rhodomonas_salina.4